MKYRIYSILFSIFSNSSRHGTNNYMRKITLGGPVKDNKDILNEAFFKKEGRREKLAKQLVQYEPVKQDNKGFLQNAYNVTDTDEVKKRLSGFFSVAFGNNSVKSMASRAIKQFPIIVSDNVEPETVVTLKRLMEEQYAEYVSLLVSNQVIDLSAYTAGEDGGNIAIQALDTISNNEFGVRKLADRAGSKGRLDTDDIFGTNAAYALLRENEMQLITGDESVDSILENAIIVPSNETDLAVKVLTEVLTSIKDHDNPTYSKDPRIKDEHQNKGGKARLSDTTFDGDKFLDNEGFVDDNKAMKAEREKDIRRGFHGLDSDQKEIYSKLTTADIVIDVDRMNQAINRSVGDILTDPDNADLRRRFEKATFLLQSKRIAGIEYFNYVTLRLGLPVSDKAKESLLKNFKLGDVINYSNVKYDNKGADSFGKLGKADLAAIASNRRVLEPIVSDICGSKVKDTVKGIASTGVGAGVGAGLSLLAILPFAPIVGVIAGAAVGGGAYLLSSLSKKMRERKSTGKIEGWERVEALIEQMEQAQKDIRNVPSVAYEPINNVFDKKNLGVPITNAERRYINDLRKLNPEEVKEQEKEEKFDISKEYKKAAETWMKRAILAESSLVGKYNIEIPETAYESIDRAILETLQELAEDREFKAELLVEATLATINTLDRRPSPITVKYVEKKSDKDIMLTPSFMSRSSFAYGSTEIERRDVKDRKYDQPLVMTVKFRERFSDGKYSDNELTAVIGILGKVIRVPSEEMEYVLRSNVEGNTLEGFFKSDIVNKLSDALSGSKISKDLKGMPQSADLWHNLEKVSTLAAANKISGKRNNNIANAHIVFSQKEIDNVRNDMNVDYLRDMKKTSALMKRYSALTLMVANDPGQRAYIFDDQDNISWNVVPYSALMGKDSSDQLSSALAKMSRLL